MYGHIDRIATGEVGTLLDRFADRFGSELDREIIVLRRKEQQEARTAQPTVELISLPDDDEQEEEEPDVEEEEEWEEEETEDLPELPREAEKRIDSELARISKQIKPLQQKYKLAKQRRQNSKVAKLSPKLRGLIDRRDLLLDVKEGRKHPSALAKSKPKKAKPMASESESEVGDDLFPDFVNIVNDLLGDMPDEFVEAFIATEGFSLLQSVAEDPEEASDELRSAFFQMANKELGELPENKLDAFVKSEGFAIFQSMGELYG